MAPEGTYPRSVIERIRREIRHIRAYIQSLPDPDGLTDIDTLLSVADSEVERLRGEAPPEDERVTAPKDVGGREGEP